jgi:transcriptional regulator with PAS, ATPase and Fis domain
VSDAPHADDDAPVLTDASGDAHRSGAAASDSEAVHRTTLLSESTNAAMLRALTTARHAASFEIPILLFGESGTGKSALAFSIHDWSARRDRPFVALSCRGPRFLRRGPSTAEPASVALHDEESQLRVPEGTVFLDEVGMLSSALQARLIRFLDEDCAGIHGCAPGRGTRVIASTSRDLEQDVRCGQFRHDVFFRLNVVSIYVPPLRERIEDLSPLVDDILEMLCRRHRRPRMCLAPDVTRAFAAYSWPGNVRELATVLEHATVLASGDTIELGDLPDRVLGRRVGALGA